MLILFGGSSEERLVSVASAQNLRQHLPEAKLIFMAPNGAIHEVSPSELSGHQDPFTKPFHPGSPAFAGSIEAALPVLKGHTFVLALHGTEGEDGSLQALLERHHIAFTGSGAKASRQSFDKKLTKEMARKNHLPVTEDLLLTHPTEKEDQAQLTGFFKTHQKIVLKPVANGSSVGLFIIENESGLNDALKKLRSDVGSYLAERFISGREITVGVRQLPNGKNVALPCSEVRVHQGRQFDYEGKYLGHGVQELTPAPIGPEETLACQRLAIQVHEMMGCAGYTRTDMILTERGPILLEINTLPGLSKASFIPQQLHAAGETLKSFFAEQIALAEKRAESAK